MKRTFKRVSARYWNKFYWAKIDGKDVYSSDGIVWAFYHEPRALKRDALIVEKDMIQYRKEQHRDAR